MKKLNKKKNSAAAELGSLGGQAIVKKRGRRYMKTLGKQGAKVRWSKSPKSK